MRSFVAPHAVMRCWRRARTVCCAMRSAILVLLVLLVTAARAAAADDGDAEKLTIGAVGASPEAEVELAAAAAAAAGGPGAQQWGEPGSALALAARVCGTAGAAAVAAPGGGARLAAAGAARAGLPLLLVEAAPAESHWEALAMFPHQDALVQAVAALCEAKGWERAVVLHEGGALLAAQLAQLASVALLARRLPPAEDAPALRDLLLVLKKSDKSKFVVWCSAACSHRVLEAAQRVGLLAERHAYIVPALDLHTTPLDTLSHGGANITALRLFDPDSEPVRAAMEEWRTQYLSLAPEAKAHAKEVVQAPPTALVLARQAAELATAAHAHLRLPPRHAANCERGRGAFHADTLLNYLRSEEWDSPLSGGEISWDVDGGRRALQLEVVEMARGGRLVHVGAWSRRAGLQWQRADPPAPAPPPDSMTNLTFNVLIALNDPYVMRRQSTLRLTGNDRYEGFCIELIEKIAEILKFNYTFVEQEGAVYGSYDNTTGQWNGMIGRLMDETENMHFAITDLTITAERERAVDFTTPFMNLGISILFRRAKVPTPAMFAFLLPFSNGVWMGLGFAYVGTSLLLYVVGRLCHEEWQNPYPCVEEPDALQNQFTLANALWFNLGAVLLQGSEVAPVAYGTRAVASVWWLFALVITSSYTANLASLLAQTTTNDLIKNVEELAHNDLGITYGAKINGSTYTFFQQATSGLYKEMFDQMRLSPSPEDNDQGVSWVANNETYAFLMESTTIEYKTERNCNVTMVGPLLDSKGYGIAMRKNSTYRQSMNLALLKLQEAGELRRMKKSWWNEKNGGGACKVKEEPTSKGLGFDSFYGLFMVLGVGCALGVLFSCVDLAASSVRAARARQEPFSRLFLAELRFVFRFKTNEKPVNGPLSESSGASSEAAESLAGEEHVAPPSRTPSRRRRSSMHAASVRRARHTQPPAAADAAASSSRRASSRRATDAGRTDER